MTGMEKKPSVFKVSKEKILAELECYNETSAEYLISHAEVYRQRYFGKRVQLHIINNLRNGHCAEDCGYCVQRKPEKTGDRVEIVAYKRKQIAEIIDEAELAWQKGAYRYCLVSAGRGPTLRDIDFYCEVIAKIKERFPLQLCLSAGLLHDSQQATRLKQAGLDRYNHNLNSTSQNYASFCTTHTYEDRLQTLENVSQAGISLCSGFIIGLGESNQDLLAMAEQCARLKIPSIPINFFLPIPGHTIKHQGSSADKRVQNYKPQYCLKILAMFRLLNPQAEIRLAAGREAYFADQQVEAIRVANSLFVEGYLNVKGESLQETLAMIHAAGYQIENHVQPLSPADPTWNVLSKQDIPKKNLGTASLELKDQNDLRPALNFSTKKTRHKGSPHRNNSTL